MTNTTRQTFNDVPLNLVDPPDEMMREAIDPDALGQLADSIAAEGLHQPIGLKGSIHPGRYTIVYGHRRFIAHQMLHAATIPARILPEGTDNLLAAITENLQRADLTPIEEALAIMRLQERGHSPAAIARLMRRSLGWCSARLDLLSLPEDLQEAIRTKSLSMSVAAMLAPVDDVAYRRLLITEAARAGASAATAGLWAQHYQAEKGRILTNAYTIEEINSRREAWRYMIDCEICTTPTAYENTRSMRMCESCFSIADSALKQEPHDIAGPPQAGSLATINRQDRPT